MIMALWCLKSNDPETFAPYSRDCPYFGLENSPVPSVLEQVQSSRGLLLPAHWRLEETPMEGLFFVCG